MKNMLSVLGMLCMIGFTTASVVQSAPLSGENQLIARGATTVEGTLMKIEGDFYVIMDSAGTERRIRVDGRTSVIGNVTPGSKVKAEVTDEGHASALKKIES